MGEYLIQFVMVNVWILVYQEKAGLTCMLDILPNNWVNTQKVKGKRSHSKQIHFTNIGQSEL